MSDPIIVCGPGDGPDYGGLNSPTGRCAEHGDFLYFCPECAEASMRPKDEHYAARGEA